MSATTLRSRSAGGRRSIGALVLAAVALVSVQLVGAPQASAHDGSTVTVYNPVTDGDGVHNDVSAWYAWGASTAPATHHIVYGSWGYKNDWAVDIFAKSANRPIVTPFGSKTNTGHPVRSTVVGVRAGCATGVIADGGYVVTIEAKDATTGAVLGRADIMHVASPQVRAGQVLGSWTTVGFTSKFRYNRCYQVSTTAGIHVHVELINQHRYACYIGRSYDQALTEMTSIGVVGSHAYGAQRARCA